MMPVISYKVGGDVAGAASGRYNAVAEQAAAKLASYGQPTAVTFWHEPYGDMSAAQYTAASKQLLPIFKRGELRVGPLLNGWLLDNKLSTFASFCPDELFEIWDWMGIDTYESGTMEAPGSEARAADPRPGGYVTSRGYDLPLGVGEYNGYSAKSIGDAGEALLSTPSIWFGCLWNSTGGKGWELTGARLAAFKETLADPRCADPGKILQIRTKTFVTAFATETAIVTLGYGRRPCHQCLVVMSSVYSAAPRASQVRPWLPVPACWPRALPVRRRTCPGPRPSPRPQLRHLHELLGPPAPR